VRLLKSTPWKDRGLGGPSQTAFVGDDTWVDLFPNEFTTAFPYPSFNTRDLDTVDNGCLDRIPDLLDGLRGLSTNSTRAYEVLVVHFLGVDHVGHTYGPNNVHMDAKLKQMDDALSEILDRLDQSTHCHTTLIMGDHGMTPEGNHGGGTEEETHAALFVHTSPACTRQEHAPWHLEEVYMSELVQENFGQIHQIDLVPTISLLLGLPLPYANLGSLVPSFMPGTSTAQAATGLALNAGQVWRYFTVYSQTANRLPNLDELQLDLDLAVTTYRRAFEAEDEESEDMYLQAAVLFKDFLHKALALGQRVWTRFDATGMFLGISVLGMGLILQAAPLLSDCIRSRWRVEDCVAATFSVFICGVLTFSNSYILEEEHILLYAAGVISAVTALRIRSEPVQATIWRGVLIVPLVLRLSGLFVTGHGMDSSLYVHFAHHSLVFLSSLAILLAGRWFLFQAKVTQGRLQTLVDCCILISLAASWWAKRQPDPDQNGYIACRIALVLWAFGVILLMVDTLRCRSQDRLETDSNMMEGTMKILLALLTVTGPSTATTVVLFSFQMVVIFLLSRWDSPLQVSSGTLAVLWRFLVRHTFFATSHACALNRLQYSAAFIATSEFSFVAGGVSLFLNTFGWEMVGLLFAVQCSRHKGRASLWRFYGVLQLVEALTSCISVSLLRRHLMVWDIYAPHFLFVSVFTLLSGVANVLAAFSTPIYS
jgi:phosphatidylinositol glycan class O